MRILALLLAALVFGSASAAFVHGDIYGPGFEKPDRTVIRVEGRFTYQLVTNKSNYSLYLPEGEYEISATSEDASGNTLASTQRLVAGADDQRLDLVLGPSWPWYHSAAIIAAAGLIAVLLWLGRLRFMKPAAIEQKPHEESGAARTPSHQAPIELDDDAKAVLRYLDGAEGRATQKELKEALRFSDAKLSLILTELEQLGHVKKFRRGRANIVRKISRAS